MSTRCQIVVMETETKMYPVKIYKHCDGYPEGVLPELVPFAKAFASNRGNDPEYMAAQIVRAFALLDGHDNYLRAVESFTGWGVSTFWHGDIQYAYKVFPSGRVECHKVTNVPNDLPEDVFPPSRLAEVADARP